ncbi:RNB domain-containing ribonuclease [Actinopolymorpha alba]|uniref:RNB domain-containing ribonuclease n=1 Tax=Actinopolymorpha alba TaxID=533267 RepID=UPI0003A58760|nr:RNB domain-containing ribonuclease [Actinopolymorpha alba]
MPRRQIRLAAADGEDVRAGFARIRAELDIPDGFPGAVEESARQAAAAAAAAVVRNAHVDRTDLPFVTIDPPDSLDLDQALHIERRGSGYRVHYAIADAATFVEPLGDLDQETHRRGVTLYAPDRRTPLHPETLCEGAASLLPGVDRPALLWTMDLDSTGEGTAVEVSRAVVRSRAKLDYPSVQRSLDSGNADGVLPLLREVGRLREERERERGGVNLPSPDRVVVQQGSGWTLEFRAPLRVEGWNAQMSLMCGMAAAQLMLYGEIGILRTLPPADARDLARLRRSAQALRVPWSDETSYAAFIRALDPAEPTHAALLASSTVLLRGAGYTSFEGGVPEQPLHAALASEYAHVTAPLRRLVDRYAAEICVALCSDQEVPEWVRAALDVLPKEMADADRRAHQYERAIIDLVEAALLRPHVGEIFMGTVTEVDQTSAKGTVQLRDPAVEASVAGQDLPLGQQVELRLVEADVQRRKVHFELA